MTLTLVTCGHSPGTMVNASHVIRSGYLVQQRRTVALRSCRGWQQCRWFEWSSTCVCMCVWCSPTLICWRWAITNTTQLQGTQTRRVDWSLRWCGMVRGSYERGLPTTHPHRIQLRDAKMWRRETIREAATGRARSKCPCSLCMFGRPLLRRTQAVHLQLYGRHPRMRLQPQVT